jgi:hypothetical protein
MKLNFEHKQSAHCENGVITNLMNFNGKKISEPMAFGIGSGLFFVYIPFLKVNFAPAISYRPLPGIIFKRFCKRTGIKIKSKKYKSRVEAKKALDAMLEKKIPVGLQVGVFDLAYFPEEYRFHFNAHNLVAYGKEGDTYYVSDPIMQTADTLTSAELEKVRFAVGVFAPKGHMYYPTYIPENLNLEKAIIKGLKATCRDMLAPMPLIGVKGMRLVSKLIKKWPEQVGEKKAKHYLIQMIRMQEEIGTGGGGFRYMFAAFLQEAADIINKPELKELSKEITKIGDDWRDFAVAASRLYKNRSDKGNGFPEVSDLLLKIANSEEVFFKKLKKAIK